MMKITVTQDNIAAGIRHDPRNCPIAVAMCKAGFAHPSVGECYGELAHGRRSLA